MSLVLLGSRDSIIVKNNSTKDFGEIWKDKNIIWYEKNYKKIYFYSMRNNEKNIENGMIEWRYKNDGLKDDGRMVRNRGIKKSGKIKNDK